MIGLRLDADDLDVLCLGAHPDDIEIGCGATLLTLADRGAHVRSVVLTGNDDRHQEARDAGRRFGSGAHGLRLEQLPDGRLPANWGLVKQLLEDVAADGPVPGVVLTPSLGDAHQDHRLLAELAPTIWRDSLLLQYEIPKWDGDLGRPTHYVGVSAEMAHRKVELLNVCYPSQHGRDWWLDETFLGLMRLRGMECRAPYAEAFSANKVRVDLG